MWVQKRWHAAFDHFIEVRRVAQGADCGLNFDYRQVTLAFQQASSAALFCISRVRAHTHSHTHTHAHTHVLQAIEAAIQCRQFSKAAGIIDFLEHGQALPYYKRIAAHYESTGNLEEVRGALV